MRATAVRAIVSDWEISRNNVSLASVLEISVCANSCQEGIFLAYPDPPPETFGQRLKRLAKAKGYTNRALAKETGAHETTVARWMMGTVPEGPTLAILIRLLDVSLDYLLEPVAASELGPGRRVSPSIETILEATEPVKVPRRKRTPVRKRGR